MGSVEASSAEGDPEGRFYSVSYDTLTRAITVGACALLALLPALTGNAILAVLSLAIVGFAYAWSPRGYTVTAAGIAVKRLIGAAVFPLTDVRQARPATGNDTRGCIRLWGSGGMFGYYGLFSTAVLGRCTWYVTDRKRMAVVVTSAKTALFSPDDRDGFLRAIREAVPVADDPPATAGSSRAAWGRRFAWALAAASLALVVFAIFYSPGPPRLTVTATELTIHDPFYGTTLRPDSVDLASVQVVEIGPDSPWRPTLRTNGFANKNYQSGWFRAQNGQTIRLYRAGSNRLVLIPPKGEGNAVLLQVDNPDQFAERLRREWH